MKLSLEDRALLVSLGERASDLLVDILDEKLPRKREATPLDKKFKDVVSQIYRISPLLSDSYILMYNHIQEEKIKEKDRYYKRLKRHESHD